MPIEDALRELKVHSREFAAVGDANKASIDANQYRKIMYDINVEIYRINRKNQELYEIAEPAGRGL